MSSRVPQPSNRRRIDRISGSVLAVLGVAVAVVAVIALRHPNGRQARPVALRTTTTATVTATATPKPSTRPRAYYDPSDPADEQAALQLQQQFPAIKRVREKFAELPAGPIVVVLTTDYS